MNTTMQAIFETVMSQLFKLEEGRHQEALGQLMEENDAVLGQHTMGFNYLGVNYGKWGNARNLPALALSLIPKMDFLMQIQKTVKLEWQAMHHSLTKVLEPCVTFQDARDALPDCLVNLIGANAEGTSFSGILRDNLSTLARTRPVAWPILNSPRDMRNFNKAEVKIQAYCAMKFIY